MYNRDFDILMTLIIDISSIFMLYNFWFDLCHLFFVVVDKFKFNIFNKLIFDSCTVKFIDF